MLEPGTSLLEVAAEHVYSTVCPVQDPFQPLVAERANTLVDLFEQADGAWQIPRHRSGLGLQNPGQRPVGVVTCIAEQRGGVVCKPISVFDPAGPDRDETLHEE